MTKIFVIVRAMVRLLILLPLAATLAVQAPQDDRRVATPTVGLVPITELGQGRYKGFTGGLYPGGSNTMPPAHHAAGVAAARGVQPRDGEGRPDRLAGRVVLLSIGMSNASQEFCASTTPLTECPCDCERSSFVAQTRADRDVERERLVIVNGAMSSQVALDWATPSHRNYDRVRDNRLKPAGVTEQQVQVVWLKVANLNPTGALPATDADAYLLETRIGDDVRALKARYPNLALLFLSSRIYAGFSVTNLNPEPYAYESAFAVKWVVESQISQMATGAGRPRAGNLDYHAGAPWIGWGPYLWADGTRRRADGLSWPRGDFEADGTHPSPAGRRKVGRALLDFFKREPMTRCWFVTGGNCEA